MQTNIVKNLLILALGFSSCSANAQVDSASCTLSPRQQAKMQKTAAATSEKEMTFFVGLYSKVENQDRAELSMALKEQDAPIKVAAIEKVQQALAERLRLDKEQLKTWLIRQDLNHDVEILRVPENNYFVLFKTTPALAEKIICASAMGELPSVFQSLGF